MEDWHSHAAFDRYSARLSKDGDTSNLLGSGILLINHNECRSLLMTCLHVLNSIADAGSFQAIFVSDPNREAIRFQKNRHFCIGQGSSSTDQDYILYEVPWKEWMDPLADTCSAEPMAGAVLRGFGFPYKYNKNVNASSPFKGGTSICFTIANSIPNGAYVYCRLKEEVQSIDRELQGFSGTGLFDQNQCLVGMLKGRDKDRINTNYIDDPELDKEVLIFRVSSLNQYLPSWNAELWENTAMVRCLSVPHFRRGIHTMRTGAGLLNLWSILLTMREPSVLFLFGGSNKLKEALEKIGLLSHHWKMYSDENSTHGGIVYSAPYGEESFRHVRQMLSMRNRASRKGPVLIHIDVTYDMISRQPSPPDSAELLECVARMGGCPDTDYIFLSEDNIVDFLCPPEAPIVSESMRRQEMIDWLWNQDNPDKLPFEKFDDDAYRIYDCVKKCKQWIEDKKWTELSDFLQNEDPDAIYLSRVVTRLNDGKQDAYSQLMTRTLEWKTCSVHRWILLLCCRWSVSRIRAMPENSADFQQLASLWESPEHTKDAVNAQIAATIHRLLFT